MIKPVEGKIMTSPKEQGRRRGEFEKTAIEYTLREIDTAIKFFGVNKKELYQLPEDLVYNVPKKYLEELQGISEGSGISYEKLVFINFGLEIVKELWAECTACVVPHEFTKNGSFLALKNRDLGPRTLYPNVFIRSRLNQCNEFVGVTQAGNVKFYNGVNEKGLFTTLTAAPGGEKMGEGVWGSIIVRQILEECNNVKDAIQLLEKRGRDVLHGANVFLGSYENVAAAELKPDHEPFICEVGKPEPRTNHYFHHINVERSPEHEIASLTRFKRAQELLNRRKLSAEDLKAISTDHAYGPGYHSICRHPPLIANALKKKTSATTLSGQIFEIGEKEIKTYTSLGQPCMTKFVPLRFQEEIPKELSTGATWLRVQKSIRIV